MRFESFAVSIAGRRAENQDAVCARSDLGLFVVADGMGGYQGGAVASGIAVQAIEELIDGGAIHEQLIWPFVAEATRDRVENEVSVATRVAGERIASSRQGELAQMGSTVVVLRVVGERCAVGHVGDSRIYRLRQGQLEQLTEDHSLWTQLLASGDVSPEAWDGFPYKNVVTRALGTPRSDADVRALPVEEGDVFLLCSDGLTEGLRPARIGELLALPAEPAARALVDEAYDNGSRDNISAVVVRAVG